MSTQQSGLVSGNKQNTPGGASPRSRSKFPLSYSQFQTERFAEYFPFFVEEGVSGDVLPLHSNHEVQTYTLKSPILQSLSKKKDYFVVPMQAILPLNWEKFYTQPNIGQDVPSDCGLGVSGFWTKARTLFNTSATQLSTILSGSLTDAQKLRAFIRFLLFFEMFYSGGSLMEYLRISGHNFFRAFYGTNLLPRTYDDFFDALIGEINNALTLSTTASIDFTIGSQGYTILSASNDYERSSRQQISLRQALELMRDDLSFTIDAINGMSGLISTLSSEYALYTFSLPSTDANLNLGRLWAYGLVCSHFYSNDHVDYIYSAELFRQYIRQLVTPSASGSTTDEVFTVNGLEYQYDALSAHYMNVVFGGFGVSSGIFGWVTTGHGTHDEAFAYFVALLGFKRSLRFQDYFTGSRALPLAGALSTSVQVNANAVDVIELSRTSMMTKFLQAVNRSGRKFSAYMQELFGKTPAYDYHNPMYLAHTSDLVGAQETDNTGAGQLDAQRNLAVTSRLRATSSRYAFEFRPDRDCIVIGLSYYDLPRVYLRATDAQNFYLDRTDMFNPFLQFIGDQAISEAEIGTDTPLQSSPFSYTNRHMEYKQRFNTGCGGFCVPSTGLDNWIFPADTLRRKMVHNISPSFIRSFNSELDRFYQRLTGYSLGTYFHFIVRYDNRQDASRPMAYNPVINI